MASVLGGSCLPPAFGRNSRGYCRYFGTSRLDWLARRLLSKTQPVVNFTEQDYLRYGGGDVCDSFAAFAKAHLGEGTPRIVTTEGMWGGFLHIQRGYEFVRGQLYGARGSAANLAQLAQRLHPGKLTVALHVRLGDFYEPKPTLAAYRGQFNVSLPLEWFTDIGCQLRRAFGDRMQFQVFSDGTSHQLAELTKAVDPVDTRCDQPSDVSDLLAMSQADLLVCSVSSYSMWAAALSGAPYVWFEPQLHAHDGGWRSIWGHEEGQSGQQGATGQSIACEAVESKPSAAGRGLAHAPGKSLDTDLLALLDERLRRRRATADLVRFGVVKPNG